MFRKMRRWKQELPQGECVQILQTEKRGVLSVHGEEGYPYGVPVNFYYDETENRIYIHGAKQGHMPDSVSKNDKVCFTVWEQGEQRDGDWSFYVRSVIAFGRTRIVEDETVRYEKAKALGIKYYPSVEEVNIELERDLKRMNLLAVDIEHMTGKLVHEK